MIIDISRGALFKALSVSLCHNTLIKQSLQISCYVLDYCTAFLYLIIVTAWGHINLSIALKLLSMNSAIRPKL